MTLEQHYYEKCNTKSDINEHLPVLRQYASRCRRIVECGVRNIVSSFAFATALKGIPDNNYILIDPYKSPTIDYFVNTCILEGVNASFHHCSDLEYSTDTDLLFIDTWHVYGQLKRELEHWHTHVDKYIILHDTTIDEVFGETLRNGWDPIQQSNESGIPVEEITKGLWPAVVEFITVHPEWTIEKRLVNNNGLTILARSVESLE